MKKILYGLLAIIMAASISCASKKWTKDDPLTKEPDTSKITIEDSVEIGIGTGVTPTATDLPNE